MDLPGITAREVARVCGASRCDVSSTDLIGFRAHVMPVGSLVAILQKNKWRQQNTTSG